MADPLYEADFVAWTERTAQSLRKRRFDEIDIDLLAQEIEDLGGSERSEVAHRLTQLLAHLLKWQFQPDYRVQYGDKSWRVSIVNQRVALRRSLRSGTLKRYAREVMPDVYGDAVLLAKAETGLKTLPVTCPYAFEEVLEMDFFPGGENDR